MAYKINFKHKTYEKSIYFIQGRKDFSTFRSSSCNAKSPIKDNVRTIQKSGTKITIDYLNQNLFYRSKSDQWLGALNMLEKRSGI